MGTDIHGKFQRKDDKTGRWVEVETEYDFGRHYQLFAVLAGVRNGFGFAGDPMGDKVKPIAEPRGLPSDIKDSDFYGDHSYSYLHSEEMIAWYQNDKIVSHVGVLDRSAYEKWDKVSVPDGYCLDISGVDVVVINDTEDEKKTENWTHIRCEWKVSLKSELSYFFDEVIRLSQIHGKIRFVFGFDS